MSKNLFRATLTVSTLAVITRILSFLFRIYLSRTIGAESLGIYQIALSVFFLFATITSGLSLTVSRKTAELNALDKTREARSFLSASLILGISISALIICVFYLFQNSFSFLFSDKRCLPIFLVLLPSCLSTSAYGIIRGWFWGKKNFSVFAFTEFFECIIRIELGLLLISGIIFGINGAYGTALSFTISDFLCTALFIILFFKLGGRFGKPHGYKQIAKSAVPLSAVRVYNSLTNSFIAIIVPALLINSGLDTTSAMQNFGRAMGMAIPLLLSPNALTGSISTVLVPVLASLQAKGETCELKRKINGSLTLASLCSMLFIALFIPLGESIGMLFYNDNLAGRFVSYSASIMLPMAINGISSTVMDSLGLEVKTMRNSMIGSGFMILSLFLLTPLIQTYSIPVGLGLSYAVTGGLNCIVLKKKIGLSLKDFFKKLLVEGVTVGVCIFGATFIKNILKSMPLIFQIAIPSIFVTMLFFVINTLYGYIDVSSFYKRRKKVRAHA